MQQKYNFVDITIYYRIKDNTYINLTDYLIQETNNTIELNSNSKLVMELCPFLNKKHYICDLTMEELLNLAGIHDNSFLKRFELSISNDEYEWILGMLCAKKIVNYQYGRIRQVDDLVYTFQRQKYINVNNKQKRVYPDIFKKRFYVSGGNIGEENNL